MTPEEVFAQLRDIHAPDTAVQAAVAYDVRPILVFLALAAIAILIRAIWKRAEAGRALSRVDRRMPADEQRDALVRLAGRRRRRTGGDPAPEAAFKPPDALTADGVQRLRAWVGRRIR